MTHPAITSDTIRAVQEWWALAGVDTGFVDDPVEWLPPADADHAKSPKAQPAAKPDAPPPPSLGGDPANWPRDLAAFDRWWLTEDSLNLGSPTARPVHRGPSGAKLMVLVPQPEAEDRDVLLSGPQGALIANMLAAMGLTDDEVRLATALPRHTPAPNWVALGAAGLGRLTLHHIAIARPQRVLALGRTVLPLIGCDPSADPREATRVIADDTTYSLLAGRDPAMLLTSPSARKDIWRRWLNWTFDA